MRVGEDAVASIDSVPKKRAGVDAPEQSSAGPVLLPLADVEGAARSPACDGKAVAAASELQSG
jgi:hypothetical protein